MIKRLIIICLSIVLFSSVELIADNKERSASKPDKQSSKSSQTKVISKSSAINRAKSQVKGKVLSATLINSKGPAVYRIKMLVGDSRVRTVFVDGVNGRIIRIN